MPVCALRVKEKPFVTNKPIPTIDTFFDSSVASGYSSKGSDRLLNSLNQKSLYSRPYAHWHLWMGTPHVQSLPLRYFWSVFVNAFKAKSRHDFLELQYTSCILKSRLKQ